MFFYYSLENWNWHQILIVVLCWSDKIMRTFYHFLVIYRHFKIWFFLFILCIIIDNFGCLRKWKCIFILTYNTIKPVTVKPWLSTELIYLYIFFLIIWTWTPAHHYTWVQMEHISIYTYMRIESRNKKYNILM